MPGTRSIKRQLEGILAQDNWKESLETLSSISPKKMTGPLFSLLMHKDRLVGWRAVEVFGLTIGRLASESLEEARVVMRQMIWRMNEESGNVGWGVPESMGAIMANNDRLADEYNRILASYIQELHGRVCDDNYLDHPPLRWGVYWGLGRLSQSRPDLVARSIPDLVHALDPDRAMEGREGTYEGLTCHDSQSRGLACWTLGNLAGQGSDAEIRKVLEAAVEDEGEVSLYNDDFLTSLTVGDVAKASLINFSVI